MTSMRRAETLLQEALTLPDNERAEIAGALLESSGKSMIASSPTVWPHFEAGTRRYVLRKFPYNIIYREIRPVLRWLP